MYVMNARDISTAPRWKLKPWNGQMAKSKQTTCWPKNIQIKRKSSRVLTCRKALAVYVTMTAVKVPNLSALLNTSIGWEHPLNLFQSALINTLLPFIMTENSRTHRCAESETWADSMTLPPPPWTGETLYWVASSHSYPYKIQGETQDYLRTVEKRETCIILMVHIQF